ncbi:aldo/keto reductase [Oculatella sp. LEGE 06141]|uniref:aldo/keto reductase n=1 Tax=Oculatella sp. LEGE 06141 TaxID=1828648 RepID=UPI00187F88E0|nr:aldo/keto reductase [Oculatella sp. LEGE 06141]MBE9177812.1 aldo/keto reductase [Oculatella sp. LEGE 06141]
MARRLGNTEIEITPILFGTWQAGKSGWVGVEDQPVIDAMKAAFDAGITTFDTAEAYGDGYSEELVAKALSGVRDKVVLATKVFANHLHYQQVLEACENSLKRLQTDYIDLYQIHWPAGTFNSDVVPIEETMKALNELKQQGKIRAIGVSNFSREQLAEAMQFGRIDSLQPPYNLFWRGVEQETMPHCVEQNVAIIAYSALAQGLLTGRFGSDHQFEEGDIRAKNKLFKGETYQRAQDALAKLRPIAERQQCTLAQLALAWLIAQPQTSAIVGARNADQATQNAKAMEIQLTKDDLTEIDAIGRGVTDQLDDNPVMWEFAA